MVLKSFSARLARTEVVELSGGDDFDRNALKEHSTEQRRVADVLIFFYMPGCEHCEAVLPHFEMLASYFHEALGEGSLLLGKMDGTSNDIEYPGLTRERVNIYPTVRTCMYVALRLST